MRVTWKFCPWLLGYFLVSGHHIRCTQRWFSPSFGTQTSSHHAQVTNGDFGKLPVRETPHMRAQCTLYRYVKRSLTNSDFHYRRTCFPHEETGLDTHTYSMTSCGDKPRFDFRDTTSTGSSHSVLNANFWSPLKLLASFRADRIPLQRISSYDSVT